jgi:hypothetical protein
MESFVKVMLEPNPMGPDGMADFFAEDIVANHWRWGTEDIVGKQAILDRYLDPHTAALSKTSAVLHDTIITEDKVIVRGEYTSTFTGEITSEAVGFTGLAPEKLKPHGREMHWRFHDIFEFEGDKITRIWWANDTLAVAREMGALPEGWA